MLSDNNRLVTQLKVPSRGRISDERGRTIAKATPRYYVVMNITENLNSDIEKAINKLLKYHKLKDEVIEKLTNLPRNITNANRYILLDECLSWADLSRYYITSSKISGIVIEKSHTREYLYPDEFSHVVGYIGSPTRSDIKNSDSAALSLPMAKIGKIGIEQQYNEELFGTAGIKHVEVNARRQFVRDIDNIDEKPGTDLILTINLDLQLEVYKILSKHNSASCVVMDIDTGAILAMVSYPGYDTNVFTNRVDKKTLQTLYENPYKPMINKVISGLYSPGSVFKMITALAGLKKGVINENTRFDCSGYTEIGKHKFHCWKWKHGGHGSMNLEDALAESCDVYFYNVAKMLSPDEIADVAKDFGLGELTGIDMPNEKSGLVPTKSWKRSKKKQSWTMGDTFNMSIGQGFVLTTPLQLAKMMAMLVNGQKPIIPHLNKSFELQRTSPLKYDQSHIQLIYDGMNAAVNEWYGTAHNSAITKENFQFGGKTGSSQVSRISETSRRAGKTVSDDYWKKEHAVFVGYAPIDNPKIVVSVLIEHGGSGAHTAAPIARDIFLATKKYVCNF